MDSSFSKGIGSMMNAMAILLLIFIPLGLWKLLEIVWWLITHIQLRLLP